jgi:serine/threonine-protein kinase
MLELGSRFGHYRIEALLGEGGMGQVYKAFDETLHRRVALKVLPVADDPHASSRIVREARAAAALEHPNKVSVFELGEVDGRPYIAMELIDGPTLRASIGDGSVAWQDSLGWLLDVARALDAAHAAGLVHRDIKPDNVMLREDGVVKVLDFGIARKSAASVDPTAPTGASGVATATGGVIAGTVSYMAPEQIRGDELDGRCDQFAWGVMAFELLSGEHPWGKGKEPLALMSAMLTRPPRVLSEMRQDLPPKVSDVISRALSSEREQRYPTMRALVAELGPVLGQSERGRPAFRGEVTTDLASARTEAAPMRSDSRSADLSSASRVAPSTSPSSWGVWAAVGVAAVSGVAAVVVQWTRRESPQPTAASTGRSSSGPHSSASAPPTAPSGAAPSAAPAASAPHTPAFPCENTKRELRASKEDLACTNGAVAWCSTSGNVLACCAPGLAPHGTEGACECPPVPGEKNEQPGCPVTTGEVSKAESIQSVVRSHFAEFRACYETALARAPDAKGTVAVYFEIDPWGDVFFARIKQSTLPDAEAETCVLRRFQALQFPPAVVTGRTVVYPIKFAPGG